MLLLEEERNDKERECRDDHVDKPGHRYAVAQKTDAQEYLRDEPETTMPDQQKDEAEIFER
jgi:hypothetical protein